MCLIAFALHAHPEYPFIFASNRDEFYERPTRRAEFWPEAPHILAGRDEREGGTWCGIDRDGRFACVTNFREPQDLTQKKRSRGEIPTRFLLGNTAPVDYIREEHERGIEYRGFNCLVGDARSLHYTSNRAERPQLLGPGIYGLSNELLDSDWPKVRQARDAMTEILGREHIETRELLEMLLDDRQAPDHQLPDTGFGRAWERVLSPIFIATNEYGTRASTVILVHRSGSVIFEEVTHLPGRPSVARRRFEW
jgi:uncharacterized protein with NRDE domain